ncbi:protein kinase [Nocardiopsis sp. NPDC007018]|uniref:WD40 repeat domain-containing serine/threonine protein kinase n=1 Tax=Nocardiopsis sp. NPDC007018 TaxID=3155721 RepID=UPI0033D0746A
MEPLRPDDPRELGRFRLLRRVGEGGMGVVFLAVSTEASGEDLAAVKVIRPEYAGEREFRARFASEVDLARRVRGPYTARVLDADTDGTRPWLATEYVPGPSLHDAVRDSGPFPESSLRVLAAGLAEALSAIHAVGLIHRDLKPSNVLLSPRGPQVIDFGIARAADATQLTRTGQALGTPAYMSPEQAVGSVVDRRSDLFSFGGVLLFTATGRQPFGTGNAPAQLYRVVNEEPDLGGVPEALRPLVTACLAKAPDNRPELGAVLSELTGTVLPLGDGDATEWLPDAVATRVRRTLAQTRIVPTLAATAVEVEAEEAARGDADEEGPGEAAGGEPPKEDKEDTATGERESGSVAAGASTGVPSDPPAEVSGSGAPHAPAEATVPPAEAAAPPTEAATPPAEAAARPAAPSDDAPPPSTGSPSAPPTPDAEPARAPTSSPSVAERTKAAAPDLRSPWADEGPAEYPGTPLPPPPEPQVVNAEETPSPRMFWLVGAATVAAVTALALVVNATGGTTTVTASGSGGDRSASNEPPPLEPTPDGTRPNHKAVVDSVFLGGGDRFATLSTAGVNVFETDRVEQVSRLTRANENFAFSYSHLAAAPDGSALAGKAVRSVNDGVAAIHVWDPQTWERHVVELPDAGDDGFFALAPDGATVYFADPGENTVSAFGVEDGEERYSVEVPGEPLSDGDPERTVQGVLHGVGTSPEGDLLVAALDNGVAVWDAATGEPHPEVPEFRPWPGTFEEATAISDGTVVSAGPQGVALWDLRSGEEPRTFPLPEELRETTATIREVALGDGGDLVFASGHDADRGDGFLVAWDAEGELVARDDSARVYLSLTASPDDSTLLVSTDRYGGEETRLVLLDEELEPVEEFTVPTR